MRERNCERVEIGGVARSGAALRKLVLDRPKQSPPDLERRAIGLGGEPPAVRELTQQLEQAQVGSRE